MSSKRTAMRVRQANAARGHAKAVQRSHKPHDGVQTYFCKPCRRRHLRFSIIGRLHKAYFEKPNT